MNAGEFRDDVRAFIARACPPALRGHGGEGFSGGRKVPIGDDFRHWFDACLERGYTVPMWPREYGGAALSRPQFLVLRAEMAAAGAPVPLGGMGVTMIGPTLLEHGSDEQKRRHLPKIASGEVRWCQGYSEPGAGSDLASLRTRAEDMGDHFVVNGTKIWTSGAQYADWIFCLVRTDPQAPKHDGISFLLFSMESPGVSVRPIRLISGVSPFCQCFFDNVRVPKEDLVGARNRGWTIAKRLLQHERSSLSGLGGAGTAGQGPSATRLLAQQRVGLRDGRIADAALRARVIDTDIQARALALAQRRAQEENLSGGTPTFVTSVFKYLNSELAKRRQELAVSLLGFDGIGWEGMPFAEDDLAATRAWLRGKAGTIAGGSSEVQLNIVAKRVIGLPD
jgi:alkylation response protein AidB-like acyl-CoA dehydrogenase